MILSGADYSKRLRGFSYETTCLISDINNGCSAEGQLKKTDIIANSELTEEQVVEKLLEIKRLYSTKE